MNPRESFTAMNKYRLAFLCNFHGSTDETPEGVPADRRAAFEAHVEYHNQALQSRFDRICQRYGAASGFFEDIPAESRADALLDLDYYAASFALDCKMELAIQRIDCAEALDRKLDKALGFPK